MIRWLGTLAVLLAIALGVALLAPRTDVRSGTSDITFPSLSVPDRSVPKANDASEAKVAKDALPFIEQKWRQVVLQLEDKPQVSISNFQFSKNFQAPISQSKKANDANAASEAPEALPPRPALSEAQVFARLYPAHYIQTLRDWQTFVHTSYGFNSEQDVFAFLPQFIDFLQLKTWLSPDHAAALRAGVSGTFSDEKRKERARITQTADTRTPPWISFLASFFSPQKTYAGLWVTGELCYKNLGPAAPSMTLHSEYCNAGLKHQEHGDDIFIPDCQEGGRICDVQLGCLNKVCPTDNAIWDPQTGICGCG